MTWQWALFITGFIATFGGLFIITSALYRDGYEWLLVRVLGIIATSLGGAAILFAILHGIWSSVEW